MVAELIVCHYIIQATYWKNIPKYNRTPRWTLGPRKEKRFRGPALIRYFHETKELKSLRAPIALRIKIPEDAVPFGRNYIPLSEGTAGSQPVEAEDDNTAAEGSDFFRDRTATFNERLRNEPENVALWLDFLRFQDEVARNYYAGDMEKEGKNESNWSLDRLIDWFTLFIGAHLFDRSIDRSIDWLIGWWVISWLIN